MVSDNDLKTFVSENLINVDVFINCTEAIKVLTEIIEYINEQRLNNGDGIFEISNEMEKNITVILQKLYELIFKKRTPFERLQYLNNQKELMGLMKESGVFEKYENYKKEKEGENKKGYSAATTGTNTAQVWGVEKAESKAMERTEFQVPDFETKDNEETGSGGSQT